LLTKADELQKMWILRKIVHPMGEIEGMEFLIDKLAMSKRILLRALSGLSLLTWLTFNSAK